MLGRRDPQRSYFDAQSLPHRVPDDSFYGRMGAVCDVLFHDDDLEMMYCLDNGRPSLPPSLMSGVTLLQFHDDVSDREAVQRLLYDLRWKVALNLPLDYGGFDPSSLCNFRKRLLEHGQERYAFSRFLVVAREAGFIPDRVTLLTDTTAVKGAGAVQDTYTLLRQGIRRLLKAAGFKVTGNHQGLSAERQALLKRYLYRNKKADIDWADAQQRAAQLRVLVQDTEAALELAMEAQEDVEVRAMGWLLTKILGDDVVTDEQGTPQIGDGTAPDRVISITDPQMRHGRKSSAQRFDGFKVVVSTEHTSELILDIADTTAMGSDGAQLMPTLQRVEAQAGCAVDRVIGDGAFGSGQNRGACADHTPHPIDLVSPVARPRDPEVDKSAFEIDLEAQTATCPKGHKVEGRAGSRRGGRPTLRFRFPRGSCEACNLFDRCVRSKRNGRSVTTHPYEAHLQKARQRQQTEQFKVLYRLRPAVERKIAELVKHGLRSTRYVGQRKRQLQRFWIAAAVNLRRLFTLATAQQVDLHLLLDRSVLPFSGLAAT